jgi:hypothetical protein
MGNDDRNKEQRRPDQFVMMQQLGAIPADPPA